MASNREEFRASDATSERYSEDYGCSWIGVIVSLLVIVGLFMILGMSGHSYIVVPIGYEPNTVFELDFIEESILWVPLTLAGVIIYWLYSRRNRSTLEVA